MPFSPMSPHAFQYENVCAPFLDGDALPFPKILEPAQLEQRDVFRRALPGARPHQAGHAPTGVAKRLGRRKTEPAGRSQDEDATGHVGDTAGWIELGMAHTARWGAHSCARHAPFGNPPTAGSQWYRRAFYLPG